MRVSAPVHSADGTTTGVPTPHHGFTLSAADRRLLRSPPPARALRWCAAAAGGAVSAVEALEGGTSSAVHGLRAGGRELVLRRFVRPEWLAEEPDAPRLEAAVLERLESSAVPAPRLVAVDPDGSLAGDPAVLMTRLPGAIRWAADDGFLGRLAAVLPAVHAVAPGPELPDYEPYALEADGPPPWAERIDVWERAFARFHAPPATAERCLVHRDFHPGNVLWTAGAVTGVVDWASARAGSPWVDVGHCRMDLARGVGVDAADRFLELYCALIGRTGYDPFWDVAAVLGGFQVGDWTPADERFLSRSLGG